MGYRGSTLAELEGVRARGQKPEGFVVVGAFDAAQWAARNRYFFIDARDLTDDLASFAGLDVIVRTASPNNLREASQRLALNARHVTVFDTRANHSEFVAV